MGLDTNCTNAKKDVATVELDTELAKMKYVQVCNSEKKKGNEEEVIIANSNTLAVSKVNNSCKGC